MHISRGVLVAKVLLYVYVADLVIISTECPTCPYAHV